MENIKVIVFDLYNTLVEIKDNRNFFLDLYKSSLNGFNVDIQTYFTYVLIMKKKDLFSEMPEEFSRLYKVKQENLISELESVVVYKEVNSVLEKLKQNYKLYLISNLAFPYAKPVYNLGLDSYFDEIIFSYECGFLKPDSNIFKTVELASEFRSEDILMIGDSLKADIKGAKEIGWNSIQINRKHTPLDNQISNLNQLKDFGLVI